MKNKTRMVISDVVVVKAFVKRSLLSTTKDNIFKFNIILVSIFIIGEPHSKFAHN